MAGGSQKRAQEQVALFPHMITKQVVSTKGMAGKNLKVFMTDGNRKKEQTSKINWSKFSESWELLIECRPLSWSILRMEHNYFSQPYQHALV